jgi:uncharacterized protein (DUF58 family)
MEFDQLKEYQEGESVRTINWAATARRGGSPLLVNTYYEEKDITVMLLVDLSASMDFGSTRIHKRTLAAEVSASLAYSALAARDRVGFVGFTAQIEYYYPPSRSKAYQRAIPEAILSGGASRTSASFWVAVEALEQRIKTPALVFLLSDFLTDDLPQITQALSKLRFRHDLIALVITDPREQSLPTGNIRIPVRDLETGEVHMYCFSAKNRRAMVEQAEKRQQQLRQMFQDRDIAHVCITPQSDYIADITQLFWTRHRRGFQ